MADPKHPERQIRDELLSLTAFDPEDSVAAFLAVDPELEPEIEDEATASEEQ